MCQRCTLLPLPGRRRSIPLRSAELHILHPGKPSICTPYESEDIVVSIDLVLPQCRASVQQHLVQTHIGAGYPDFRHACPRCGESWSNEVIAKISFLFVFMLKAIWVAVTMLVFKRFSVLNVLPVKANIGRCTSKGIWRATNVSLVMNSPMSVRLAGKVLASDYLPQM